MLNLMHRSEEVGTGKKSHDNHSHVVHVRVACAVHIIGMLINCVAANLGASPHGS